MQRIANPSTPVRFRPEPPFFRIEAKAVNDFVTWPNAARHCGQSCFINHYLLRVLVGNLSILSRMGLQGRGSPGLALLSPVLR